MKKGILPYVIVAGGLSTVALVLMLLGGSSPDAEQSNNLLYQLLPFLQGSNQGQPSSVPSLPTQNNSLYTISLSIYPPSICIGQGTRGTITTNIPNGACSIFADIGTGFQIYKSINLDSTGSYDEYQYINTPGAVMLRAICCDSAGNCVQSKDKLLRVTTCGQDSDGDGWSDDQENQAGTDPNNPNDFPGSDTTTTTIPREECDSTTLACGITCTQIGYQYAECAQDYCPAGWNYIGLYGCNEEAGCDVCCCSGTQQSTTTTTTTVPYTTTTTTTAGCYDSDGGINLYVGGYIRTSNGNIHNDACTGSNSMYEFFCPESGGLGQAHRYCENGCETVGGYGRCKTAPTTTTTTVPPNPVCGHSYGQYCYGYDVAYHSSTYDSSKCNTFPKIGGSDCLFNCAYKGVDNYNMYCWCWDKEPCGGYSSCTNSGCEEATFTCTAQGFGTSSYGEQGVCKEGPTYGNWVRTYNAQCYDDNTIKEWVCHIGNGEYPCTVQYTDCPSDKYCYNGMCGIYSCTTSGGVCTEKFIPIGGSSIVVGTHPGMVCVKFGISFEPGQCGYL